MGWEERRRRVDFDLKEVLWMIFGGLRQRSKARICMTQVDAEVSGL
jgi:hypothetical protein